MNDEDQFPLRWRGQVSGPFPLARILQMLDEHEIGTWHEVQHQGRWLALEELLQLRERERARRAAPAPVLRKVGASEVQRLPSAGPVRALPATAATPAPPSEATLARFRPKRYRIFAALGLGLGFAGAHNFYAGYWGTAVAQLLLTALTWWLGLGIIAAWLWAWLELLLVHTDRRGVRME